MEWREKEERVSAQGVVADRSVAIASCRKGCWRNWSSCARVVFVGRTRFRPMGGKIGVSTAVKMALSSYHRLVYSATRSCSSARRVREQRLRCNAIPHRAASRSRRYACVFPPSKKSSLIIQRYQVGLHKN